MFDLRKLTALFRGADLTPYQQALRAIDIGEYQAACDLLGALLADPALAQKDRAKMENKRGIALLHLGRKDEALAAFARALELIPNFAPALVNVGNALLEDGSVEEAVVHYEAAIRADDDYHVAHFNLGVAYKRMGRQSDSVRELRRARRLEGRWGMKPSKYR